MAGTENTAAVISNVIAVFSAGMSQQNRDDVRNCLHYCVLAADKQFPDEVEGTKWYGVLTAALKQFGWISVSNSYDRVGSNDFGVTLEQIGVDFMKAALSAAALPGLSAASIVPLIGTAMAGMQASVEASSLFNRKAKTDRGSKFGIAACSESADGDVAMALGVVSSDVQSSSTQALFATYSSASTQTYAGNAVLLFNPPIYAQVRDQLLTALGNNAKDATVLFPIG